MTHPGYQLLAVYPDGVPVEIGKPYLSLHDALTARDDLREKYPGPGSHHFVTDRDDEERGELDWDDLEDQEPRKIRVRRSAHSRNPWRLIDSETGLEISYPKAFDHPDLGPTTISMVGFRTKEEAIDYLGEMAARALKAVA